MIIQFPHRSPNPVPSEAPRVRPIGLYLLLAFSLLYLASVLWVQHYVPKRPPEPTPATKQATTPLVPMNNSLGSRRTLEGGSMFGQIFAIAVALGLVWWFGRKEGSW